MTLPAHPIPSRTKPEDLHRLLNERDRHLASWSAELAYRPCRAATAALTLEPNAHEIIFADVTGGGFTVTLPRADRAKGVWFTVLKTDASGNTLTLDGDGGETINGATTQTTTTQYAGWRVVSDGTEWYMTNIP